LVKTLEEYIAEEGEKQTLHPELKAGEEAERFLEVELARDLKPRDVALLLNIHVNTVKRWLALCWFTGAYRLGTRGDWRIPRDSLESVKNQYRGW